MTCPTPAHLPRLLVVSMLALAACAPPLPAATLPPSAAAATPSPQASTLPRGTPPPAETATLTPSAQVIIDRILGEVEQLRGLSPLMPIPVTFEAEEGLRLAAGRAALSGQPRTETERLVRLLKALGVVVLSYDLESLYPPPSSEHLDGLLADDHDAILVAEEPLDQRAAGAIAGAYTRALVSQTLIANHAKANSDACATKDRDGCTAVRALFEGDGLLLEEQWQRIYGTATASLPAATAEPAYPGLNLEASPDALRQEILFPSQQGIEFVRSLFLRGGWAAVDDAYASPPVSSEQILHPSHYPRDLPRSVQLSEPSLPADSGWQMVDSGSLGEWTTRLALQPWLAPDLAQAAAAGWGGDQYQLFTNAGDGRLALVVLFRWDTLRDAHEFAAAFRQYAAARFGRGEGNASSMDWTTSEGTTRFELASDQALWITAPDEATAISLRRGLRFPLP